MKIHVTNDTEHKGEQRGNTAGRPDRCRFVWNVSVSRHYSWSKFNKYAY